MKVALVLPYLPSFRREFLRALASELAKRGDLLVLFYGQPRTTKVFRRQGLRALNIDFKHAIYHFLV